IVDRLAFGRQEPPAQKLAPQTDESNHGAPQFSSGENTIVFGGSEPQEQPLASRPKASIQTSMLPGTAGSRSEQQAMTSVVQMGRITSPVEESDALTEEAESSGALKTEAASEQELTQHEAEIQAT